MPKLGTLGINHLITTAFPVQSNLHKMLSFFLNLLALGHLQEIISFSTRSMKKPGLQKSFQGLLIKIRKSVCLVSCLLRPVFDRWSCFICERLIVVTKRVSETLMKICLPKHLGYWLPSSCHVPSSWQRREASPLKSSYPAEHPTSTREPTAKELFISSLNMTEDGFICRTIYGKFSHERTHVGAGMERERGKEPQTKEKNEFIIVPLNKWGHVTVSTFSMMTIRNRQNSMPELDYISSRQTMNCVCMPCEE